jgi:[histone H3]-lysine4 N-trimethyltransferase ATXR3
LFFFVFYRYRKDKKLRDHHQGDLGRVTRSIPVGECDKIFDDKDDYDPHPFVYDIELILGGKLTAVRRSELQYTTAFEEGMTGESRQKRQRKHKEEPSDNLAAPANAKKKPKKFSTVKSTGNQASNKKRGASASANKGGKTKKPKVSLSAPEPLILPSANSNGLDIFERHRREFERSLVRLEKADTYGYFTGDDIPPEYDECYHNTAFSSSQFDKYTAATVTTQQSQNPSNVPMISAPILPPPALATQTSTGTDTSSIVTHDSTPEISMHNPPPINVVTPSTIDGPPFNFVVLRKRLEQGRYILDRERFETEERIKLLTPYYKSIGKRIPSSKKKLPNFLVYHKKGIDWDLFRKDVLGMCDAAVQRRPDFAGDGGAGTIAGGAKKIKELMEQIYDKIAKKHYLEMEITNDTHRYTTAINASPNMEAAMQGKRWRREGTFSNQHETFFVS